MPAILLGAPNAVSRAVADQVTHDTRVGTDLETVLAESTETNSKRAAYEGIPPKKAWSLSPPAGYIIDRDADCVHVRYCRRRANSHA
jgi:hypothetical protein